MACVGLSFSHVCQLDMTLVANMCAIWPRCAKHIGQELSISTVTKLSVTECILFIVLCRLRLVLRAKDIVPKYRMQCPLDCTPHRPRHHTLYVCCGVNCPKTLRLALSAAVTYWSMLRLSRSRDAYLSSFARSSEDAFATLASCRCFSTLWLHSLTVLAEASALPLIIGLANVLKHQWSAVGISQRDNRVGMDLLACDGVAHFSLHFTGTYAAFRKGGLHGSADV